jgi:hypothetical protein
MNAIFENFFGEYGRLSLNAGRFKVKTWRGFFEGFFSRW